MLVGTGVFVRRGLPVGRGVSPGAGVLVDFITLRLGVGVDVLDGVSADRAAVEKAEGVGVMIATADRPPGIVHAESEIQYSSAGSGTKFT